MEKFFALRSTFELFEKLERELHRLHDEPANTDHAFNFFVTADSLVDWLHPKDENAKKGLRNENYLLQITCHLANGAKHFGPLRSHHKSIETTDLQGGYFANGYFSRNWFPEGYFAAPILMVTPTKGREKISAIELATKVFEDWRSRLVKNNDA